MSELRGLSPNREGIFKNKDATRCLNRVWGKRERIRLLALQQQESSSNSFIRIKIN